MNRSTLFALLACALILGACSPKKNASSTAEPISSAGKQIFNAQCAQCHGPGGQGGGIGPSLRDEKSRKNFEQTQAWIKNPQPPMPKLYPAQISDKDVRDVAAYVQSL